jgi:hypothetical protein
MRGMRLFSYTTARTKVLVALTLIADLLSIL